MFAFTIMAFDSKSAGLDAKSIPEAVGLSDFKNSNIVSKSDDIYLHGTMEETISIIDRPSSEAVFWVPEIEKLPYWEAGAPFRIILNRWAIPMGMQLIHAGSGRY